MEEFDPQTEADRSAQRVIIGSLSKLYPDIVIIGEEVNIFFNNCVRSFQKLRLRCLGVLIYYL